MKPSKIHIPETLHLFIICAFHLEAKAIIDHYGLKKSTEPLPFDYFSNSDIGLLVCGMGKMAAASAVGFLAGMAIQSNGIHIPRAWLNVGLAGHRSHEVGTGFLINKITDTNTTVNYYPDLISQLNLKNASLITVEKVENVYDSSSLFDMEGAGFYCSASKFTTQEHIACYKIVSDNKIYSAANVDKKAVPHYVSENIEQINMIIEQLRLSINQYNATYKIPDEYYQYISNIHFTKTQQEQLKALINRWNLIEEKTVTMQFPVAHYNQSKTLLRDLNDYLNGLFTQ